MKLISTIVLLLFPSLVFSQAVFVSYSPISSFEPTVYDMLTCTLNNTEESQEAYLDMIVYKEGELISAVRTDVFTLENGITVINSFNINSVFSNVFDVSEEYGAVMNDYMYNVVLQTSQLPAGNYTFCITVYNLNSVALSNPDVCGSMYSFPINAPNLLLPDNGVNIETLNPIFSWTHATPFNENVRYTVQIVELFEGQSSYEAFEANPIYHTSMEQMANIYQYPVSGMEFKPCHIYAWRVTGEYFASNPSEIHEFIYKCDEEEVFEEMEDSSIESDMYYTLSRDITYKITTVKSNFKILIENSYSDITLDYSILDNDQVDLAASNSITNILSNDEVLSSGTNIFNVNIELLGLIPGNIYVLRINNLKRLKYLKFKYEEDL